MSEEDQRWKQWWKGASRPFIVLSPAQMANAELLAELEAKFPGVDVRPSELLPIR